MAKVLSRNDRNRRGFPELHHVFHTAKERKTWTKLNLTFNLLSRIRSEQVDQTWLLGLKRCDWASTSQAAAAAWRQQCSTTISLQHQRKQLKTQRRSLKVGGVIMTSSWYHPVLRPSGQCGCHLQFPVCFGNWKIPYLEVWAVPEGEQ